MESQGTTMEPDAVIRAVNLSKSYGKVKAVENLNLKVDKREFFGFLGPNGAGKTTTIKILTGQVKPDAGEAKIMGIDIKEGKEVKKAVGIIPEVVALPSFLTVEEYLEFVCRVRNVRTDRIQFWLDFTELYESRDSLCKDLSLGMKQKLSFAAAFIHEPKLVFLDEPFADVDPLMQSKVKKFLKEYTEKGGTIFLSTHILEIAEKLCSQIAVINKGAIVKMGGLEEVLGGRELEDVFIDLVRTHG